MKVYIFPQSSLDDAGKIQAAVEALGANKLVHDPTRSASPKIDTVYVDLVLPFTKDDIDPGHSFGNGVTKTTLTLKDNRKFDVVWIVIDDLDVANFDSKLQILRTLI